MKSPNWKRYREMLLVRNVFFTIRVLGYAFAVSAFIILYAMAGHSDSVSLWKIYEETWTTHTYIIVTLSAVSCGVVGYIFINVGSLIHERARKWVARFENYWNNYFTNY